MLALKKLWLFKWLLICHTPHPEQGIVAANSYLHPLLIKMLGKDNA